MAQYTQINPDALVTALTPINNSLDGKQDKTTDTEGYVRLSSPNGIVDTRNGDIFAEVIVKAKSAKWFKEVEDKVE